MSEWISVKERLPKENETVLFFMKDKWGHYQIVGFYDNLNRHWTSEMTGFLLPCDKDMHDELTFKKKYVTHWMPLPLPPKDK